MAKAATISAPASWTPLNLLFPYQRRIVEDPARFKIISCARQSGKSTVFACEAAMDCAANPRSNWVALSVGLRQTKEWLVKAAQWAELWCETFTNAGAPTAFFAKSEQIEFSNGSRIIALPANANTARGYSANLILDEFAYHEKPDKIWAAISPSISNEISTKYKIRIGSTVAGKNNKFWALLDGRDATWSRHKITIDDAVAGGLPIDRDAIRAGIADEDIWRQEYLCEPVDSATALLPFDTIAACESDEADTAFDADLLFRAENSRRFVLGMDIGRAHDLTVFWLAEILGNGTLLTREIRELRKTPLDEQQRILFRYLAAPSLVCACIDGTGIGYQLAENAEREFGSRAVRYQFTENSKRDLFLGLQTAFQRRKILVPKGNETLRDDLHSVQRLFTSGGRILFSAPTNADGHADRATAAALAVMATNKAAGISDSAGTVDLRGALFDGVPSIFSEPKFI